MSNYLEELGYTRVPVDNGWPPWSPRNRMVAGARCDACEKLVTAEGPILRSHRRWCPVAPREVPTPGVCDA